MPASAVEDAESARAARAEKLVPESEPGPELAPEPEPEPEPTAVLIEGFPHALYNGLYEVDGAAPAANGQPHYANQHGMHLYARRSAEWCLKDAFDPGSSSARALSGAAGPTAPQPGESDWRWWDSGWKTVRVTVALGDAARRRQQVRPHPSHPTLSPPTPRWHAQQAAAATEQEADAAALEAEWGQLSKELVMVLMRLTRHKRSTQAMACVCKQWRDAAVERIRRPSVALGALTSDT